MLELTQRRGKPEGGYLFLPSRFRRGVFLKWLRRTHAWVGLWGAALGLLFGFTGILLNHRAQMKIPLAKTVTHVIQVTLPDPLPVSPEELAIYLRRELAIEGAMHVKTQAAERVSWNGHEMVLPVHWTFTFNKPAFSVNADYWLGNRYVTVKHGDANFFAMLTRLHTGSGLGAGWILLADSLGGALVLLALTGVLLWTRLHGARLTAISIGLTSIAFLFWFAVPA
jgi:hypothetical protein